MLNTEALIAKLNAQHEEVLKHHKATDEETSDIRERLKHLELARSRMGGGGDGGGVLRRDVGPNSLGTKVIEHDDYKSSASGMRDKRDKLQLAIKAVTSASGSGGALVAPDHRPEPVTMPRQRIAVRDLLAPGETRSNMVQYPRQTLRSDQANVVSEAARKPESSYGFELVDAPVRTIAHFTKASRQVWDDAQMLRGAIDNELRYGLLLKEEAQLLYGDGDGQNLHGIVPQATAYIAPFAVEDENRLDQLLLAVAQAQQALLPATGIIVNDMDWFRMMATKDGEGRYLGSGPFGSQPAVAWTLPVVATPSMAENKFLVGAFADGAQLFDREEISVLISSENEDDFVRNLVTVLCEERLALAVKRPQAFVYGEFESTT